MVMSCRKSLPNIHVHDEVKNAELQLGINK